jgi:hypothetical protein
MAIPLYRLESLGRYLFPLGKHIKIKTHVPDHMTVNPRQNRFISPGQSQTLDFSAAHHHHCLCAIDQRLLERAFKRLIQVMASQHALV